ncbi:Factor VIII intron 22 protein [Eufriesea mexicana]|nr:Factor VIII intron 22 protein [Eufriesea mexicana]
MGDSLDFLTKYHNISNKLKKKPNVAEASDQFGALAIECEQKELWQYAGLCLLAAARCQGTLENIFSELNLLIRAGREFLVADKKVKDIGCPPIGQENTQAAISCFGHALTRCHNQSGFGTMSAGLALELALALGPTPAGTQQLRDYVSALQILNDFVEFVESYINAGARGNYSVILYRCEVTRVLLLLILQPSPQRLAPSLAQVLEKYAWVEESTDNDFIMSEDELLLLQSLVLACQSHDYQALLELEGELWSYLNAEQKELLHKLIQVLTIQ